MTENEIVESPGWDWRLTHTPTGQATIELAPDFDEWDGAWLTELMRGIGGTLIQVGTRLLQSHISDEEDDWDDE
jgi:hypothetical protein